MNRDPSRHHSDTEAETRNPKSRQAEGETKPQRWTRRRLLQTVAASAARIVPTPFFGACADAHFAWLGGGDESPAPVKNPAWFGFNLLEYFSTDPDWMKYFPYKADGMFREDDFRWIRDWGFNFVRLPMDYRFWTDASDLMSISEKHVEPVDRAIRLGEKYGVHVNFCLHRAPGECILDGMNEALTGIHITQERTNLYENEQALEAFIYQWTYFAERYRSIPVAQLSFNLVNEPKYRLSAAEEADLKGHKPDDAFSRELSHRHELQYVRVARETIDAIRTRDPERVIVSDGYPVANSPVPELFDTGVMQACHTYIPAPLTHYHTEWAPAYSTPDTPLPTWPLKDRQGRVFDRAALAAIFQPWADLPRRGIPIHFAEMGANKHTPPNVVLAWFDDTLSVLNDLHTGWALWNFRGPFGIVDSERPGTKYEDWQGHQLDRALLGLLQRRMKL
jgi:endoglucanase